MSKKIDEPIYFHNTQPVLVKLGEIYGQQLFVELKGDAELREHDYLLISSVLRNALGFNEVGHSKDNEESSHV
ncbi:MAG TPA: hypothetical protein VJ836_00700 [Candidatus Saccharimonadales bacterium]|nr:hypothetical protein [Candidatus Saccharimonadales bacterium]